MKAKTTILALALLGPLMGAALAADGGLSTQITALAIAPDGARALSGASDGTLRWWQLGAASPDAMPAGRIEGAIRDVAFGPADLAAAVADQGELFLLRPDQAPRKLGVHEGGAFSVAVSSDGALVATGGGDGVVRIWRTADGSVAQEMKGHEGPVGGLAFAGKLLYSAGWDRTLRAWSPSNGRARGRWEGGARELCALAAGPDGKRLLTACFDGDVRVWDAKHAKAVSLPDRPHGEWVTDVAFSADGARGVAVAAAEGALLVFAIDDPTKPTTIADPRGPSVAVFLPAGDALLVGRFDGSVERVEIPAGGKP